jgi:hypothetical protein
VVLQTRDGHKLFPQDKILADHGSAAQRFTLHRVQGTI